MGYPAYQTMKLYITRYHFILQTPDLGTTYQLIIERETGRSYCSENFNPLEHGASAREIYYLDIFMIVGIVPINEVLYLLVVTEADIIDSLKQLNIYTIKNVKFIPISVEIKETEPDKAEIQNLSKLLSSGFYFSYYFDLTRPFSKHSDTPCLHRTADQSFYWNFELCRDFTSQGVDPQWFVPIIQGYVGIQSVSLDNLNVHLALISRRSCERTGTRFNCRGLDDEGNVANYVETEQILICGDSTFSYVQVRGSVPLFWEQTGMTAQVSITRSHEMNHIGLRKHTDLISQKFSRIAMLNLLSKSKSGEKELAETWEELINTLNQVFEGRVFYEAFDFNQECKGNKFSSLNEFIEKGGIADYLNFFYFSLKKGDQDEYSQKGVIRTNCLDCLDRTNVMQSYLGWAVLKMQTEELKVALTGSLEGSTSPICRVFKNLWADNGDALSMQYTGTGSNSSSFTREGKTGFSSIISHGLKSINRFYNANVEDAGRQKCIDFLLRKRGEARLLAGDLKLTQSRKADFTQFKKFKLRAVTWNLGGQKVDENSDLSEIIIGSAPPDILFISFEECVKLNTRNILQEGNNKETVKNLENIVERSLQNSNSHYTQLCQNDLVGICLFIYAKSALCDHITKLETDAIRAGFGGMGNKGAVAGRLSLFDTSICVLGCHLESGNENNEARISQLIDMHNRAFQQEKVGKNNIYHVGQHNLRFIMGDLNFRIQFPNVQVRHKISKGEFRDLVGEDQLIQALTRGRIPGYKEHPIEFPPTYKFDFGTDVYDTSKKQRIPAWCDRILFCGEGVECRDYGSVDNRISDHRPVFADFEITAEEVDEEKKRKIEEEIIGGEREEEEVREV